MALKRRFINYENSHFEVIIDGNGYKLVPIEAKEVSDALAEAALLSNPEVADDENNLFQQVIDSTAKTLKSTLEKKLKEAVLGCIGFSKSWGDWEIDNCNSRNSHMSKLISDDIKKRISEVTYEEINLTPNEILKLRDSAKKDFLDNYYYALKREVSNMAQNLAKEHVDEAITEVIKSKTKYVAEAILDNILTGNNKA